MKKKAIAETSVLILAMLLTACQSSFSDNKSDETVDKPEEAVSAVSNEIQEESTDSFVSEAAMTAASETTAASITSAAEETEAEKTETEPLPTITKGDITGMIVSEYPDLIISDLVFFEKGYAIALLTEGYDDFGAKGKVVYANQSTVTELASEGSWIEKPIQVYEYDSYQLATVSQVAGATATRAFVWKMDENGAEDVSFAVGNRFAETLVRMDDIYYTFIVSAYDILYDFDIGITNGHSWKDYYLKWDGERFVELGGIKITEDELLAVDGGKELLEFSREGGQEIASIIYRENGVININTETPWDGSIMNNNVSARIVDNVIGSDYISNDGFYLLSLQDADENGEYPSTVSFPTRWPY